MTVLIGGVESFTTVDFPSRLAAVLFCAGCPLNCPYCHNPSLRDFNAKPFITWDVFEEFLKSRQKLLDGIVFSGGEPLAQKDLKESIEIVKSYGYQVGMHTSGVNPARLAEVLPLLDWVGFDVKTLFECYADRIGGSNGAIVEKCLDMVIDSGVSFEARTTLDPRVISTDELKRLADVLRDKGVKTYALQEYRLHPAEKNPPDESAVRAFFRDKELLSDLKSKFAELIIRTANGNDA